MHRTAALLMVILLAVGCGPQPEEGGIARPTAGTQPGAVAEATGTVEATSTGPSDASSSPGGGADATHRDDGVTATPAGSPPPVQALGNGGVASRVALPGLPPGPASPDTPPPYRWYLALQTGRCAGLDDTATDTSLPDAERAMFASLAQVCRLLEGQRGDVDWAAAQAALEGSADVNGCLAVAARELLASAVEAHRADPGALLVRGEAQPGTACPVTITSAVMTGPTSMLLVGDYLIEPSEVRVAGQTVGAQFDGPSPGDNQTLIGQVAVALPEGFCASVGDVLGVEVAGPGYDVATDVVVPDVGQGPCPGPSGSPASGSPSESQPSESRPAGSPSPVSPSESRPAGSQPSESG